MAIVALAMTPVAGAVTGGASAPPPSPDTSGGSDAAPLTTPLPTAQLSRDGRTAIPPASAPQEVKNAIYAANRIVGKPYRYGGGHRRFNDTGYDCSGSVSFALRGGGLLKRPLHSRAFMSWGDAGKGREIFVSEEIYQRELEQVFGRAWLFIGHESQVKNPGDYLVSSMGEESVILSRDRSGKIRVFLNSCRHRGMKVCRYDEGNTVEFLCPYHGWSYGTDGALVGVPFAREAYGEAFDRKRWGLVEVARMENYKGTIWATWAPDAPPFLDYIGGYQLYLDLLLNGWDGSEGGRDGRQGATEVIGGIHKWLIPCNWKFPAENFSGDRYHGVSHRSVDLVGIGPSGQGRRDIGERNQARWLDVSFPELGHSMIAFLRPPDAPIAPAYQDAPAVAEYFRRCEEERRRRSEKAEAQARRDLVPTTRPEGAPRRPPRRRPLQRDAALSSATPHDHSVGVCCKSLCSQSASSWFVGPLGELGCGAQLVPGHLPGECADGPGRPLRQHCRAAGADPFDRGVWNAATFTKEQLAPFRTEFKTFVLGFTLPTIGAAAERAVEAIATQPRFGRS